MTLRNAFESMALEHTASSGDAHLVSGNRVRFRKDFVDPTLADWDVATGTGMTVTAGNSALVITTGTTASQTTTVTSKQTFGAPFKAAFGFKISQKIANQEFYVEIVAVDDAGNIDENVVASWRVAGSDTTSTTTGRYEVKNGGAGAKLQSGNVTTPTQTTDFIFELTLESDETWFHARAIDSTAGRTASYARNSVSPDPSKKYKIRYRVVNGSAAPASSTTFTSAFATGVDYTEFNVEVAGGQGSTGIGQAIPVYTTGSATTSTNSTLIASSTATAGTVGKVLSAATTNATSLKTTQARLISYQLTNTTASFRFVKFFNKTSAPTVGTDVPVTTVAIPPNSVITYSPQYGLTFASGLAYSITGALADNDTTAVAVGDVIGHINYI